ncbi:MAG: CHASE2 domain-containing protein [Candidatus Eutrophobiaceae bacterium]
MKISSRKGRRILATVLSLLLSTLFLLERQGYYHWDFMDRMENQLYDWRLLLNMDENTNDDRIVIIDIDEKSLSEVGRWPWSRSVMAQLMEQLFNGYGVRLVVFDVLFREADTSSGLPVLEALAKQDLAEVEEYQRHLPDLRKRLDNDRLFGESMQLGPVILAHTFFSENDSVRVLSGALSEPILSVAEMQGRRVFAPQADGYGGNVPILQRNSIGSGHITPTVDEDGSIRRVPMLVEYQGNYYESLSLAAARVLLGVFEVDLVSFRLG